MYREILALREAGLNLITVANRPPAPEHLPPDVAWLQANTHYIFPLNSRKFTVMFFAQIFFLFRHTRRYIKAISILLSERSNNPGIWRRNLMHFIGATYLAWELRNEQVTHLHAHFSTNAASLACFVSILLNIPFSMTIHNEIFAERLLLPAKLRRSQFIVCISEYSRQALIHDYPKIALMSKIPIIHCGVLPTSHETKRHSIPTILSAAQLVKRKGTIYLVEACHILKERGLTFRCIIAGDGEERAKLEAKAGNEIIFLGRYHQSDLESIFTQADIFVLPCINSPSGDRDGIPVALMEAMSIGLPVISTTVSGIPELIDNEMDGLLVEEKNAEALADAIERLLTDNMLYERLRNAAKHKVETKFNLQVESQRLAALFNEKSSDD